jgi:hypothetical protein
MTTYMPFRDILHAANLWHGTDGITSPPKEGVLRIFSPLKIRQLRPGLNRKGKRKVPVHANQAYRGRWGTAPLSRNFSTTWKLVVSCTPQTHHDHGKDNPQYSLSRKPGMPQSQFGHFAEDRIHLPLMGVESWHIQPTGLSQHSAQLTCHSKPSLVSTV